MNRTSIVMATAAAMTVWSGAGAGEIVAKIPGPDGSWDYASFDSVGHRILISRADGVIAVRMPFHCPAPFLPSAVLGHARKTPRRACCTFRQRTTFADRRVNRSPSPGLSEF
jgi:hypothetical protein